MDVLLIVFLTLLNGVFAMSEMALASSRKARLAALDEAGDKGATAALALLEQPTQFLSTVQVGITSIGMLNGILGEAAFSEALGRWLQGQGMAEAPAAVTATALVVTVITFVTIIFGELVPKRIGQMYPEAVARWVARPMATLARLAGPFVRLLSMSTQGVLRLMHINNQRGQAVTEEEITASLAEGVSAGLIEEHEHQMVRNVFHLDDRPLSSLMVPRTDIVWLGHDESVSKALAQLRSRPSHSWYPVCRGGLDDVVGLVSLADLLQQDDDTLSLEQLAQPAAFIPETLSGLDLLEQFRRPIAQRQGPGMARLVLVVDEYGVVQGLMTPRDLLEAITGEWVGLATDDHAWATRQPDGSWLLDGAMPIVEFKNRLGIEQDLPDEDKDRYNTVAGLFMLLLGRLPEQGERVACQGWMLEVTALEGRRIERLRATSAQGVDADQPQVTATQGQPGPKG